MKNRDCSRTLPGAGRAAGIRFGAAVSAVLTLGACSSVPDAVNPVQWYKSAERVVTGGEQPADDASTSAASADADAPAYTPPEIPGRDQPFPNLGEGPERPIVRTPAETGRLTEGLIADRARSRHAERGIPLQGMSGERRSALPAMADGEQVLDPEAAAVATGPSSPQVIRTQIRPAAPPRAEGAAQGPVSAEQRAAAMRRVAPSAGAARAPGAPAAASDPRQASGSPSRVAFSNTPPPSGPSVSTSAPPPRPQFSDVAPPTLGLTSAPPRRQQPVPVEPPVAPARDLLPPPPPGLASPAADEEARGPASDPAAGDDVAALGQAADPVAETSRSERIATIHFERGMELGEAERDILRQVAALHQQRGGTIRVVGHRGAAEGDQPDQEGTMNEQMSLEQANAVAQELIRLGVSRQQIRAVATTGTPASGEAGAAGAEVYFIY